MQFVISKFFIHNTMYSRVSEKRFFSVHSLWLWHTILEKHKNYIQKIISIHNYNRQMRRIHNNNNRKIIFVTYHLDVQNSFYHSMMNYCSLPAMTAVDSRCSHLIHRHNCHRINLTLPFAQSLMVFHNLYGKWQEEIH